MGTVLGSYCRMLFANYALDCQTRMNHELLKSSEVGQRLSQWKLSLNSGAQNVPHPFDEFLIVILHLRLLLGLLGSAKLSPERAY
jgi:hypothetical protein